MWFSHERWEPPLPLWRITKQDDSIILMYSPSALPELAEWQQCGACEPVLYRDLLGWVADQAGQADLVETPAGTLVKLLGPGGGPACA
jgi:hypothetical protein